MIKEKNYYCAEDMVMLDQEREFIPLTFDGMFKGLFKKDLNLLKDFIMSQIGLEIEDGMYKIEIMDSELVKDKIDEYQKTVDINVLINNMYVNIEINREYFKNVEKRNFIFADKLHTMMLKRGDDTKSLENKMFIQINLNAVDKYDEDNNKLKYGTDKIVYYGLDTGKIYNSNNFVYVKYLEYYRDLYYNGDEKLDDSCLWLVLFTSKSFLEMYNILGKLFDNDRREQFIRNVINMIDDRKIFEDWEIEKLNEFVKYKSEKDLRERALKEGHTEGFEKGHAEGHAEGLAEGYEQGQIEGFEQGIENGKEEASREYIIRMLEMNLNIKDISKITNKTEEKILEIKNNFIDSKE